MRSKRMTSAPSCASVNPPNGAATNADPSTTRMPDSNTTNANLPARHALWTVHCSVDHTSSGQRNNEFEGPNRSSQESVDVGEEVRVGAAEAGDVRLPHVGQE